MVRVMSTIKHWWIDLSRVVIDRLSVDPTLIQWLFLVPLKGGRQHITPQKAIYKWQWYKWYILPIGWLYATYHLLGEPETTIDWLRLCLGGRGWKLQSPFISYLKTQIGSWIEAHSPLEKEVPDLPSLKLTVRTWKLVIGRWFSSWVPVYFRGLC